MVVFCFVIFLCSLFILLQPFMLLPLLSQSVHKYLQITDDDHTVGLFVLGLYDSITNPTYEAFLAAIISNGGEDFPRPFVKECYETIRREKLKPEVTSTQDNGGNNNDTRQSSDLAKYKETRYQESNGERRDKNDSTHGVDKNTNGIDKGKDKITHGFETTDRSESTKKQSFRSEIPSTSTKGTTNDKPPPHRSSRDVSSLVSGSIVAGTVTKLTTYGAFVRLESGESGLCHVSQIRTEHVEVPADVLRVGEQVYVKILEIERARGKRDRISLSMKSVDQETGMERISHSRATYEESGRGRLEHTGNTRTRKRLSSPERWEIRQLIASGVVSADDYPDIDEEDEEVVEVPPAQQVDVEVRATVPKFLEGAAPVDVNAVRVYKNPEGSLMRTAQAGSKLMRDRKDTKGGVKSSGDPIDDMERLKTQNKVGQTDNRSSETKSSSKTTEVSSKSSSKDPLSATSKALSTSSTSSNRPHNRSQSSEPLPIFAHRLQLLEAIRDNQFVVVVGETGSGKTTQLVQYLMQDGFDHGKMIACTQPRRVAATSVARRVAEEVGCRVGETVGYTVRFDDRTSRDTVIKFMTDGMLEREALNDPAMSRYLVVMLDEAHERTVATDVLFALVKQAAASNPQLRVVVTSATLDSDKFARYFGGCPVVTIPGRTFPVEVMYTKQPEMDYMSAALESVVQIHLSEGPGDILVFLTGQDEIDTACDVLRDKMTVLAGAAGELIVLPVYAALAPEQQARIFEPAPPGARKVVLATNIAETSITIDGVFYVVDPGFVKLNAYDPKLGMDTLAVTPISQAQANQRSGRAGRTGPGKCYRLYTEAAFRDEMAANTVPEIQRQNLASTILMLKAMGIEDVLGFEFMDPPAVPAMLAAMRDLYNLGALDELSTLTSLGRRMADFPMEPALTKMLLCAVDMRCAADAVSVVAMLSVQTVFMRPKDKQQQADQKHARFRLVHGDHLTLLNVYNAWVHNGRNRAWCSDHYIQERSMRKAEDVRRQVATIMQRLRYPLESAGGDVDRVRRAVCAGFFKNCARRDGVEGGYKTLVGSTAVHIHPSSALFAKKPEYVVYHTLLLTSREYMHCVTTIDPRWLVELAPQFFAVADAATTKKRQKIVPLHDRFGRGDSWRLSAHNEAKRKALSEEK